MTIDELLKRRDQVNTRISVAEGQAQARKAQKEELANKLKEVGVIVEGKSDDELIEFRDRLTISLEEDMKKLEEAIADAESKL